MEKENRFYQRLQVPILMRIAGIARDLEDWPTVHRRAEQLVHILIDLGISGTPESAEAWDLYYTAQGRLREMGLLDADNQQENAAIE